MIIYIIAIGFMLIGNYVGGQLRKRFQRYSQTPLAIGLTGKQVAERMLSDNGITDVQVISVKGQLTDHYNPAKKTVNLSEVVFNQANAAAAAVAAHEVGHAVQHARSYSWLQMRSKLVPVVSLASRYIQWVLLAGILLIQVFPYLLLAGIVLFACTTLFAFITLPVEYDASNRALAWMKGNSIVTSSEYEMSEDALKWAARTYVVGALNSLATLLYYVSIFLNRRR